MKSHFPVQFRTPSPIAVNKAIVCVRNPLDIIVSEFNLHLTATHNKNIDGNVAREFPDQWDWFVQRDIKTWHNFNEYWIRMAAGARNGGVPVYFFRYEDLVLNPYQIAKEVMAFVLGFPSIEGTYLDYRIRQVINQGQSSSVLYKPRSGSINGNLTSYTEAQLDLIKKTCRDQLHFFGYTNKKNPDHFNTDGTTFFHFDDESASHGFIASNKAHMDWVTSEKEAVSLIEYEIEKPGQGFSSMLMEDETSKVFSSVRKLIKVKK